MKRRAANVHSIVSLRQHVVEWSRPQGIPAATPQSVGICGKSSCGAKSGPKPPKSNGDCSAANGGPPTGASR